jgi:hypothetical protein
VDTNLTRHFGMRREARASDVQLHIGESILPIVVMDSGLALRAPRNDGCEGAPQRFQTISLAAISPPPAISTAAIAMLALGFANPANIKKAVDSSGVA